MLAARNVICCSRAVSTTALAVDTPDRTRELTLLPTGELPKSIRIFQPYKPSVAEEHPSAGETTPDRSVVRLRRGGRTDLRDGGIGFERRPAVVGFRGLVARRPKVRN